MTDRLSRLLLAIPLVVVSWSLASTANAQDKAVDRAIRLGVEHLKSKNGYQSDALVGLALLECGVPANDPAIVKIAERIRDSAVEETQTYHVSLDIMFLDRLGDLRDVPLIEALVIRMIAGQNEDGGWSYRCPKQDADEVRRLKSLVERRNELVARAELPGADTPRKKHRQLTNEEVTKQVARLRNDQEKDGPPMRGGRRPPPRPFGHGGGDNSNTQFAAMALWIAKRSDLPIDAAASSLDTRFRKSQCSDGGWGYTSHSGGAGGGTPSMTCAGLLGLAVARGANISKLEVNKEPGVKPRPNSETDPVVRNALLALGTSVGAEANATNLYYLWSLERVAMAYGLPTVGKKDWYAWGSKALIRQQRQDGSWAGGWGGADVGTCFALLFLKRANLVEDLTTTLKGQVQDPGEVALRNGGVGFEDFKRFQLGKDRTPEEVQADADARAKAEAREKLEPTPAGELSDDPSAQLAKALLDAPALKQVELIEKYRDTKGGEYTQALALAIHKLPAETRGAARDALAQRLTRMTVNTLRDKLADDDVEVRFAAALACGMKKNKEIFPDLVKALSDPERVVWRAASLSLQMLSGKDFGPQKDADLAARKKSADEWSAWWQKNGEGPGMEEAVRARARARAELVKKYAKMTAADLRVLLVDNDPMIRSASAEVAGQKRDKTLVPFLIPMIDHDDRDVAHHAHVALTKITGKDFGPNSATPSDEEKADARKRWENWQKLNTPNANPGRPAAPIK